MGRRINKNERKGNEKMKKVVAVSLGTVYTSDLINKKVIIDTNKKIVTKA